MNHGSIKYLFASLCLALVAASGCGGKPAAADGDKARSEPAVSTAVETSPTASDVLRTLLKTYREAKSYADDGKVVLRFRQSGNLVEDEWPSAVSFERPNRLFTKAYQATVACDGKELRARIEDPETGDVDGQVLVRPAPKELKLKDLAADPLLYDILSSQLRRQPIQLELLLESQGLASAFRGDVACKLLDEASAEGCVCHRVEVPSPGGSFIFWVDAQNSLLRRLEYPAAALIPALAQDPTVKDLSLTAELKGARLNSSLPKQQFTLAIPEGAKRMKTLVIPPRPLPSDLFGQRVEDFFLTQLDGSKLASKDLAGEIAVLTWFRDDPACRGTLAQVEQARLEFSDQKHVAFYAVNTDPTTRSGEELATLLASWTVGMTLVRDLEAFGDSHFKIQVQPTVIVLDGNGRVQIVQAGGGPELGRQLGVILERLLKGENVAGEIVKRAQAEQAEYAKLIASGGPEPTDLLEIPETVIRPRSEPKRIKLEEIWTCKEVKSPGNLYFITKSGRPNVLLAISGWRSVSEITLDGEVLAHHELPIPPQAAVTYLREGKDTKGNRLHLGSAPLAPGFFLFDEDWKLKLTHPADGTGPQLADVQLARLKGTDELAIYAGGVDLAGLHALSISGKSLWKSRTFPNVLGIATMPGKSDGSGDEGLLLTGDAGTLLRVSGDGKEQPPQGVGKTPIASAFRANFRGATQARFLGIATNEKGETTAVGFDETFKSWWEYPLPPGGHQRPIEPIASGVLLPNHAGTWVIAAPDGSIHFVSEDGELTDSFHYGAAITGVTICEIDSAPALVVATDEGITAWRVQ